MSSQTEYQICAVDGGGTGCRAVIGRSDGEILARAAGGPANYTTNPIQATENLRKAVDQALSLAGSGALPLERTVAHVGLAGIMCEDDSQALAAQLPFAHCSVSDDRLTSALGGLGDRNGALLAIGTGSFAAGRRGASVRFLGGYGFKAGDQASGAWLGRELLCHTLLACDGLAEPSDLTRAVFARFDEKIHRLATYSATSDPSQFASFAPQIVEAAGDGDPVGQKVMRDGAAYLNAALDALALKETDAVCLIGGLGPHYATYLAPRYQALIAPSQGTALDGAMTLARKHLETAS
ncbi:BadF/BadG/BcrA/BcrD ATPase family protein [Fluviibacterium sp. DFM31]|uniref:BadF/BadG/BcrA/BcrD ATPase family protein n=1 Tax=Meridianimarinicoccus marinus TaxID=3231483 RepID=A0ABV3LA83_9RHOB